MLGYLLVVVMLLLTAAGQVFFKHHHVSGRKLSLLVAVGLFVAVVPLNFLTVRMIGLAPVYIFMSLSYGIVAFMGWRMFGEKVNRMQCLGIAIVVLGCAIYSI